MRKRITQKERINGIEDRKKYNFEGYCFFKKKEVMIL